MVPDWFGMIYGIAENPRPKGKCVKYTPAAWGLMYIKIEVNEINRKTSNTDKW